LSRTQRCIDFLHVPRLRASEVESIFIPVMRHEKCVSQEVQVGDKKGNSALCVHLLLVPYRTSAGIGPCGLDTP
jgi:hypothetical protein